MVLQFLILILFDFYNFFVLFVVFDVVLYFSQITVNYKYNLLFAYFKIKLN